MTVIRSALAVASFVSATLALGSAASAWQAETTRELAVREGPSMDDPFIEVIPPGSLVRVEHCGESSWCKVAVADGTVGFVRRAYLQGVDVGPPPPPPPGVNIYVGPRPYYYGYGYGTRRHW